MAPCSPWDPLSVTWGHRARDLCFCMGVPDGCLTTGADVRDGAGMHSHSGSSSTGLGWCGAMEKLSPGYHPSCGISGCTLTNTFNLQESQVMLSEVMVGLQLPMAWMPSVPKDQLFPSGSVLLPAPWWGWSAVGIPVSSRATSWWLSEVGWTLGCVPVLVWHRSWAAQAHLLLQCCAVQLAAGLLASPKLFQHLSWVPPKKTHQTLLYLFLCFWIVGGKICFTTAEIV